MNLIIKFDDGSRMYYDSGKFDDWCVYVDESIPHDSEYFWKMQQLAHEYGKERVYADFVWVYDRTDDEINPEVILHKYEYGRKLFILLHAVMVAEENKAFTKLGKRIKRLGVYQLLFEGLSNYEAANYSRNKSWEFLDGECEKRGF